MTDKFSCPCCGSGTVTEDCLRLYLRISMELGFMPFVSSAFRCKAHNSEVGGEVDSLHLLGEAVDCIVPDDMNLEDFAQVAISCGAGGVGRYSGSWHMVHIDVGERRDWFVVK